MYFSVPEKSTVQRSFGHAEKLAERYFVLGSGGIRSLRYEVQTLAHLNEAEIREDAFAHLCRYYCRKEGRDDHPHNYYFYKVCLQDNRILDAVERGSSFIKLGPLMLYIALHELVHVVRFHSGDVDFNASIEEKILEEDRVHGITRNILHPIGDPDVNLVIDCFTERYHVGDIFTVAPERRN